MVEANNNKAEDQTKTLDPLWKDIFAGAWQGLSSNFRWDLYFLIVALLITPGAGILMNKPQWIIGGVAAALTLIIWVPAVHLIRKAGVVALSKDEVVTPPVEALPRFRPLRANTQIITISVAGFTQVWDNQDLEKRPYSPLPMAGPSTLSIRLEAGVVLVNATIYNANFPAFVLKDNDYDYLPPGWDANLDDDVLEIMDEKNEPVLQVIFKSDTELQINGIFLIPAVTTDKGVVIRTASVLVAHGNTMQGTNPDLFKENPLRAIFKYPSYLYPQKRAE